jgi:hypothetical protein
MASLPPAMNFAEMEEDICKKWKEEDSFKMQDKLSLERGDEVSCCNQPEWIKPTLFQTDSLTFLIC